MNYKTVVNVNSIDQFSDRVQEETKKMEEILNKLILMSNDMEYFFDTPTGRKMKETLIEFLKTSKAECEELENYGLRMKKLNRVYYNTISQIKDSVRRED